MRILRMLGFGLCLAATCAATTCPSIFVSTTAAHSNVNTRDVLASDGRVVHLAQQPLLTSSDFTKAEVRTVGLQRPLQPFQSAPTSPSALMSEGQVILNIGLTPEASKRWVEFTGKNVGAQVAFVVNGVVVVAPTIRDANTDNGLMMGPFSKAEGQVFADRINNCTSERQ